MCNSTLRSLASDANSELAKAKSQYKLNTGVGEDLVMNMLSGPHFKESKPTESKQRLTSLKGDPNSNRRRRLGPQLNIFIVKSQLDLTRVFLPESLFKINISTVTAKPLLQCKNDSDCTS